MTLALVKTLGVVLKEQDYKENNKLLWIYTEKNGKITAIAKGAKKNSNKLFSASLPLTFGEYVLFKGRGLYTISEGRIINSFRGCLDDLEKLTYSTYLCELIDISMVDDEKNEGLFKELVTSLYLLNSNALDNEVLIRAFELKLLKSTGYALDLDNCCKCRRRLSYCDYISLAYSGGVCNNCEKSYGIPISSSTYNVLRYLNSHSLDNIYKLKINANIKEEIYSVMKSLIGSVYQRRPKSLDMLDIIKEDGNKNE
ncbi:DNA repair protein RecO [Clostridium sp.]|uniref:DNA repair protein RecO n=1 Tax=Clostridium sp. TaxID=1506 RepID=UPI0034643A4C